MAKKTIKAQMKQRRDTKANWEATNPVLLAGELGIVSDDPNLYKVGDGTTAWNSLPFRGFDGTLSQELGTSPNAVISQKVVSEKLTELESNIGIVQKTVYDLSGKQDFRTIFNIDIKEGQEFYIRLTGTTDASRLILRYNSASTNNLKDYAKLNTWYRFVAPMDITSIYLWYDGSVDLTCELKTSIAGDIVKLQNATSEIVGHESHVSKEITSGNSYSTLFNLDIKKGQEFFIRLTGTTSASRLILRYNSASSNNIKDYAKLKTWYRFVAPVDITSIYLWYNGSVDLTCELKTSIGADTAIYNMITTNPLTQMPDYVVEILSKKTLGALSKGYFCLSDDDGTIGLSTYTIPMITEKSFPITMSLFKESEVFEQDGTTQQVLDAIANVGCSVAQHGGIHWTDLAEKDLADWFDDQRQFFNEIGIETKGAVIPAHRTSALVEAIAGAKYGVVRCGYNGQDAAGNSNYRTIYDKQWTAATSIPRSNMYCLSSSNVLDYPLDTWKGIIDNAIQNHLFVSVHMHDFDFVESVEDYKQKRAILEGLIDYVKESGITIIQLGDIPGLV